jgi:hypothetical protein
MSKTLHRVLVLGWLGACAGGSRDGLPPYRLGQALVIGDEDGGRLTDLDETCDDDECAAAIERCGHDAYADVVLDDAGDVADVLCYRGNVNIEEIGEAAVERAEAGNNTVLVFDGVDDGADVSGDVVLAGNNAIIYGEGADVSVIGGSLAIDKNNAIVRGVSISGDVTIDKNNAQLSFVVIEGDLTIEGNNTTLAECIVHGQVNIRGVNTVLVQNRFAGADLVSGKNLTCNGNVRFDDADADHEVDTSEEGVAVACEPELAENAEP